MPMKTPSWEDALKALQPAQSGGVAPPAAPGNSGNMPYAPGAMTNMKPQGMPLARDLYQGQGPTGPPPSSGGGMGPQMPMGQGGQGMPYEQAQGLVNALTQIIRGQFAPSATRGPGTRY